MLLNYTNLFMNNLILLLKKDLIKLIIDLQNKKIIGEINIDNISIDYSSKSKQGDLSTNIFIIINKKNINNNFNLKNYITKYLSNLEYVSNIEIVKAGFVNINFQKFESCNLFELNRTKKCKKFACLHETD